MEPAAVALRGSRHLSVTPLEKQASGKARLPDRRRQRQVTGCNSPWPERHRAPPGPPRTCQEQIAKLTRFPFALLVRRLGHRSDSGAQTAEKEYSERQKWSQESIIMGELCEMLQKKKKKESISPPGRKVESTKESWL